MDGERIGNILLGNSGGRVRISFWVLNEYSVVKERGYM